ncbi:MAG TPA: nucleotidyltransferase domain-containing protein [Gaiellaceae bacterium]
MGSASGATARLRALAERLTEAYPRRGAPHAALLVGSAGRGDADEYSDLDLLLYYDELPSEEALAEVRGEVGAERFRGRGDEEGYGERYYLDGIQCQVAHVAIDSAEREIDRLVVQLELDEELLKIVSGLHEGFPLFGEDVIDRWRRAAAYTDELQRALIEKHWTFFPWWHFEERLGRRDTTIWRYDVLVQSSYSLVAVLAALNRLYFSKLELKHAGDLLGRLEIAPANLAARLEALYELDERGSTAELERLVEETGALVAERFPDVDLSLEWGGTPTPPGSREAPWR